MNAELRALKENGTWDLTTLPYGKKANGSHWIFKTKLKVDGLVEWKKARLVVQGNKQRKGVDYEETFAPVAKMVIVRPLLAIATMKGYVVQGEFIQNVSSCDTSKSKADYSLFVKKDSSSFTVVLVYVDDLLITRRAGVLNSKPYTLLMDQHLKLQANTGTPLPDPESLTSVHMQVAKHLLRYLLNVPGQVALLKDLGLKDLGPVDMCCDNQATIHIAANHMFHARTKHIVVDCHYVRDQVQVGTVKPSYVHTTQQVVDVFIKVLSVDQHYNLLNKMGVSNPSYSHLEGEC
ncbi:retrovirus-related pol polyprotein from transposon TNT 1-94 [Tanacetum coccineum]